MKLFILKIIIIATFLQSRAFVQQEMATAGPNNPGKAIFIGRCGTCHDADASKKLLDGSTLLGRLVKNKDPETRLATRLKNEHERHQVFLYLQPMIERERLSLRKHGNMPL